MVALEETVKRRRWERLHSDCSLKAHFYQLSVFFLFSLFKKSNVLFGRRDVFSELVPSVDLLRIWHLKLKTFRPERFQIQMS